MIVVTLYGELAKLYGKNHKYVVKTVPEAIRALEANHNGFRNAIKEDAKYRVVVDKKVITEDQLGKVAYQSIKIIPIVQGSGRGLGQAILGIALLSFAFFGPWSAVTTGMQGFAVSAMKSIGFSLVLGGISAALTKTPSNKSGADSPDKNPSYLFDGPINTTAQGNPVSLAYGIMLCGSQVISAGLEVR